MGSRDISVLNKNLGIVQSGPFLRSCHIIIIPVNQQVLHFKFQKWLRSRKRRIKML